MVLEVVSNRSVKTFAFNLLAPLEIQVIGRVEINVGASSGWRAREGLLRAFSRCHGQQADAKAHFAVGKNPAAGKG